MREILFRGKRLDNGKWVMGFCVHHRNVAHYILDVSYGGYEDIDGGFFVPRWYAVEPSSVGQYTGLTDKNGKRIFEGDIVLFKWDKEHNYCHIIEFVDGEFCATPVISRDDTWQIRICGENEKFSVIGNIHDNPELMEVQECH